MRLGRLDDRHVEVPPGAQQPRRNADPAVATADDHPLVAARGVACGAAWDGERSSPVATATEAMFGPLSIGGKVDRVYRLSRQTPPFPSGQTTETGLLFR